TDAVKVVTAYDYRRTDLAVGVDYNTSLPEASQLLLQTIGEIEEVIPEPSPEVDVVDFSDSSIDFVVRYWSNSPQRQIRKVQTKARMAIKKAFDEANISIPYPIRTLYHYDREKYRDYSPVEVEQTN
ncbi:MAG: hypothetical protein RLZZ574_931, partial [Cyanobacteriota bacterium]